MSGTRLRSSVVLLALVAAELPPAAHDRDDAGAIGLCWTVHVERERQTILVPVHHSRRTEGWRAGAGQRRYRAWRWAVLSPKTIPR
jgi:hypothetical protein